MFCRVGAKEQGPMTARREERAGSLRLLNDKKGLSREPESTGKPLHSEGKGSRPSASAELQIALRQEVLGFLV